MRLDDARLCLDCEEIHDERECPACGSEAFAFLKRWIKSSGQEDALRRAPRRAHEAASRPSTTSEQLDAWKRIIEGEPAPRRGRMVTRGLLGLLAMGIAGWVWMRPGAGKSGARQTDGEQADAD